MNKTELSAKVAQIAELDKKTADKAVNAVFETLSQAFEAEEKVQIMGFGTFETRERAARQGRNPATGESIEIPAGKTLVFKASKTLKK
mgnify:CR=1 FL=1